MYYTQFLDEPNTYMPFNKERKDTVLIAFWSAFPRYTCCKGSQNFPSHCWKLFYDFNIFREKRYKPVNIENLGEVAAPKRCQINIFLSEFT